MVRIYTFKDTLTSCKNVAIITGCDGQEAVQ